MHKFSSPFYTLGIAIVFLIILYIGVNLVVAITMVIYWLSGTSVIGTALFIIGCTWFFVWVIMSEYRIDNKKQDEDSKE